MPLCDQCQCNYPADLESDACPNCGERIRRCPWCGETLPWSFPGRNTPCCSKPLKYVRPVGADVPLLHRGEGEDSGPVFLRVAEAIYFGGNSTIYKVIPTKRLGDPFLLNGEAPPPAMALKEILLDPRIGEPPIPQEVIDRILRLKRPNLLRLHAAWSNGDRFFMLHDWLPGVSAADRYILKGGRRAATASELKRIAEEILDGLSALSEEGTGLIHGDVTPYNILFADDGRAVLTDWGNAMRIDAPKRPKEITPHFAPPEFYPREQMPPQSAFPPETPPSPASDRYMLGASLYAIASGREARETHEDTGLPVIVSAPDRARGVMQTRLGALRSDLPRPFNQWIDQILSLMPEDRFSSCDEAKKALKNGSSIHGKSRGTKAESAQRSPSPRRRIRAVPRIRLPLAAFFWLAVFATMALVGMMHPTAFVTPWAWPRLARADLSLIRRNPESTLKILRDAKMTDWEEQILLARARVQLGAPENALSQLAKVGSAPDAPGRILVELRSLSYEVGQTEIRKGLRLLERGDRYGAYLTLRKAAENKVFTPQADRALVQLASERGDEAAVQRYLDQYLSDSPDSIQARYSAAQAALARNDLSQASACALKAKELSRKPSDQRIEPVSDDALDRLLKRIADAYLSPVPKNPARISRPSRLQERIERILEARSLAPSASLDLELARYYARLGDVSKGSERALYYQKADDDLKRSASQYGANAESAALQAKCEKKLSASRG